MLDWYLVWGLSLTRWVLPSKFVFEFRVNSCLMSFKRKDESTLRPESLGLSREVETPTQMFIGALGGCGRSVERSLSPRSTTIYTTTPFLFSNLEGNYGTKGGVVG